MNGDTLSLAQVVLDVFARASRPLSAVEAARAANIDLISGAATVRRLANVGRIARVNDRQPARYEHASRAEARLLPAINVRPSPGTLTPFGVICGPSAAEAVRA